MKLFDLSKLYLFSNYYFAMGWNDTWNDILSGGPKRWKVDDVETKAIALGHIEKHAGPNQKLSIFCPLAGDDPFVHYAWSRGHTVAAAELVPAALEQIRNQFQEGSWKKEHISQDTTAWKHDSGRAILYETDIVVKIPNLDSKFDAIYDKDSFGALEKSMRKPFCERMSEYLRPGGIVYTEVKFKDEDSTDRNNGPPFHVTKDVLMEENNFGKLFEYVAWLDKVYDIPMPGMKQTGHILRRVAK